MLGNNWNGSFITEEEVDDNSILLLVIGIILPKVKIRRSKNCILFETFILRY